MAARLSERYRVLLLEKGGTPVPLTQNLYFTKNVSDHPAITSYYPSLPQEQFNMENGGASAAYIPKMLGGSSSNGECTYNRGNPADYDYIANVTGDETWAYSHAIKHFKRIENYVGMLITEKERAEYYGVGGPLTVETVQDPILQSWFQAGRELGFNVSDPNGRQTEGIQVKTKFRTNK
ncbi:oxygen-dependent choline dehydrogenase [Folsomia candida]|uniref:oxygen-dependent choline dehydrogenase n=1 Tax=Folsomia candida TaxID=158441 RepID=UPI001604BB2D|nr:oxygen-dependent choline dehydrogenase [Folsomia candida]